MTEQEIQGLTDREVAPGTHEWLGTHFIAREGGASLRLWLKDDRLESLLLSKVDGFRVMSIRLSPRQNLCTGELTFRLTLLLPEGLVGATLFLDGREVAEVERWPRVFLEVPAGDHQLKLEKDGYEPIVKAIHYEAGDRGDPELVIEARELVQSGQSPHS